jgi:hypothetical protein
VIEAVPLLPLLSVAVSVMTWSPTGSVAVNCSPVPIGVLPAVEDGHASALRQDLEEHAVEMERVIRQGAESPGNCGPARLTEAGLSA